MNAPEPVRIKNADIVGDFGTYFLSYETKDGKLIMVKLPAIRSREFKLLGYRAPAVRGSGTDNEPTMQLTWEQAQTLRSQLLPLLGPGITIGGVEHAATMLALIGQEGRVTQETAQADVSAYSSGRLG